VVNVIQNSCYSSQGGENWLKTDVKLACKAVFCQFSTSGERPMLLTRVSRARRWNCPLYLYSMHAWLLARDTRARRWPPPI